MQKGRPSRASSWVWDAATDKAIHHEVRYDGNAHKISVHDVALLANEYMVSYDVAAIRLRDINTISRSQLNFLLEQKGHGKQLLRALKIFDQFEDEKESDEQPYLIRQLIILAIEAFRREKISTGRFRSVCELANIPYSDLMPVAMAGIDG